jgi:ribonuclease HII
MLKSRHTVDDVAEVGIDEAGRGCLWGPLVAAAVVWPDESTWTEELRAISGKLRDSKKVSPKLRATLELKIKEHAVAWSIGVVTAQEIDSLGMTKTNRIAFERALQGITVPYGRLLIDGTLGIALTENIEQVVEPKGDDTYLSIAAASILAKEGRDAVVRTLCEADPLLESRYSIGSSKGYGTLKHREAIKLHGMHPNHRRLFLRKLLGLEHKVSQGYMFQEED